MNLKKSPHSGDRWRSSSIVTYRGISCYSALSWTIHAYETLSLARRGLELLLETAAGAGGRGARFEVVEGCRRDAPPVEQAAEGLHPSVRGVGRGDGFAWAPQPLGDCAEARPHGLLQIGGVDRLAPHLALPTQDEAALGGVNDVDAWLVAVERLPADVEVVKVPRVVAGRVVDESVVAL
eukprot:4379790-Prymnesium_polylepis.1